MHSVKLSVDERDSVRSVGGMSESCAILLLGSTAGFYCCYAEGSNE